MLHYINISILKNILKIYLINKEAVTVKNKIEIEKAG